MANVIEILTEAASWEAAAYVAGHGPVMHVGDIREILQYDHWVFGEARKRYDKGMSHQEAADDLIDHLGNYETRRNPQGIYHSMQMMFSEFAGNWHDHLRRNYPKYLAHSLRLGEEFARRHPNLASEQATGAPREPALIWSGATGLAWRRHDGAHPVFGQHPRPSVERAA